MREFLHEHFLHGKSLDEFSQIIRKAEDVNNLLLRLQLQRGKFISYIFCIKNIILKI